MGLVLQGMDAKKNILIPAFKENMEDGEQKNRKLQQRVLVPMREVSTGGRG